MDQEECSGHTEPSRPEPRGYFPWGGETEKQSSKIAGRRESETIDTEET